MTIERSTRPLERATRYAGHIGIQTPILLAPMAGASPPALSIAVASAGGMGACGALLMDAGAIRAWVEEFRRHSKGEFQINLSIPSPAAPRDLAAEARQREFLAAWGPPVPPEAGDAVLPDFASQCEAMLELRPRAISSIMVFMSPNLSPR
jgi:nitronate monooxygenase